MRERVVLGIGLASSATLEEVRTLVDTVLQRHRVGLDDVAAIATRDRFVDDERLQLGPPVVGYPDTLLEAASAPCTRTVGIRARVAETAALLASGGEASTGQPAVPVARSAHVTVAIAIVAGIGAGR